MSRVRLSRARTQRAHQPHTYEPDETFSVRGFLAVLYNAGLGALSMTRRPIRRTASLILLMLFLPVAAADTIQMFTNGSDSASFGTRTNIRADSGLLYDGDSVKILSLIHI